MDIKNSEISVLNYNENIVVVSTRDAQYTFNPAEKGVPTSIPFSLKEIEYMNSSSPVFRDGTLRFEEDVQEKIYKHLRITKWEDIFTIEEMKDSILSPTVEKLQKILDIKSVAVIERLKGVLTKLKNSNEDISIKVDKLISNRYSEIAHGKYNTSIKVSQKDTQATKSIQKVEAENAAIKEELAEMKKMLESLSAANEKPAKKTVKKPSTSTTKEE